GVAPSNADLTLHVEKEEIDPNDPSVVYARPFVQIKGFKTYNGTAYDRACLWIEPKTRLVLPDSATEVVRYDAPHTVTIYMEKRINHHSHHGDDLWPIPKDRPAMGCAVKRENGALVIGSFGEYGYMEGGVRLRLLVQVPREVEVSRKAGLVGGLGGLGGNERSPGLIDPAPGEPRPTLTEQREGRRE